MTKKRSVGAVLGQIDGVLERASTVTSRYIREHFRYSDPRISGVVEQVADSENSSAHRKNVLIVVGTALGVLATKELFHNTLVACVEAVIGYVATRGEYCLASFRAESQLEAQGIEPTN